MFGKEATEDMTMTVYEKPTKQVIEAASHGSEYKTTIEFSETGDYTDVTMTFEAKAISFAAKLFTPMAFFMKRSMQKAFQKDLDDIKAFIEK